MVRDQEEMRIREGEEGSGEAVGDAQEVSEILLN